MVISLPNIRHLSALSSLFLKGTFPRRERGIFDQTHLRWFTIRDAGALITDSGFVVDEMTFTLRVGDKGDRKINRILNRFPSCLKGWRPIREFLTYQFCIRAIAAE